MRRAAGLLSKGNGTTCKHSRTKLIDAWTTHCSRKTKKRIKGTLACTTRV